MQKSVCRLSIMMDGETYSGEMEIDGTIMIRNNEESVPADKLHESFQVLWNFYDTAANVVHSHYCLIFCIR